MWTRRNVFVHLDKDAQYFAENMGVSLSWLVERASREPCLVREKTLVKCSADQGIDGQLQQRLDGALYLKLGTGTLFFVSKATLPQRLVLQSLSKLRFLNGGHIRIWEAPSGANLDGGKPHVKSPKQVIELPPEKVLLLTRAYHEQVCKTSPQWMVPLAAVGAVGGTGGARAFVDHVTPCVVSVSDGIVLVFGVWSQATLTWGLPGGGVKLAEDCSFWGAARREWDEEVLGFPWADAVGVELPLTQDIQDPSGRTLAFFAQKNALYTAACAAYVFARSATPLLLGVPIGCVVQLPLPDGKKLLFEHSMTDEERRLVHCSDEALLVEHETACWLRMDPVLGTFFSPDGRAVNRTQFAVFRKRPHAIWRFLDLPQEEASADELQRSVVEVVRYPARWVDLLRKRSGPIQEETGATFCIRDHERACDCEVEVTGPAENVQDCLDKLEQLRVWAEKKLGSSTCGNSGTAAACKSDGFAEGKRNRTWLRRDAKAARIDHGAGRFNGGSVDGSFDS